MRKGVSSLSHSISIRFEFSARTNLWGKGDWVRNGL